MKPLPRSRGLERQVLSKLMRINERLASDAFDSFVQSQAPPTKHDLVYFSRKLYSFPGELITMSWGSGSRDYVAADLTEALDRLMAQAVALDDGVKLAETMRQVTLLISALTAAKSRTLTVLFGIGAAICLCVLYLLVQYHRVSTSYIDEDFAFRNMEVQILQGRPQQTKSWFNSKWFKWVPPTIDSPTAGTPSLVENIKQGNPTNEDRRMFPWPPPRASAVEIIPRDLLVPSPWLVVYLKDVNSALDDAFRRCGYGEKSYYTLGDGYPGFALATRIEQINEDGTPSKDRWSVDVPAMHEFSLLTYLQALFTAGRTGHFRIIVFVVTSQPFVQSDRQASAAEAEAWAKKGWNLLPSVLGDPEYSADFNCTALIYEFERIGGRAPRFVEPSRMTGRLHLAKAGLLYALSYRAKGPAVGIPKD